MLLGPRFTPYLLLGTLTLAAGLGMGLGLSEAPVAHVVGPRNAAPVTVSDPSLEPTCSALSTGTEVTVTCSGATPGLAVHLFAPSRDLCVPKTVVVSRGRGAVQRAEDFVSRHCRGG
jgi:hypothetical protein